MMWMGGTLLTNQIRGILVLPRALRGSNVTVSELVHPLAGKDRVMICGGQGMLSD